MPCGREPYRDRRRVTLLGDSGKKVDPSSIALKGKIENVPLFLLTRFFLSLLQNESTDLSLISSSSIVAVNSSGHGTPAPTWPDRLPRRQNPNAALPPSPSPGRPKAPSF